MYHKEIIYMGLYKEESRIGSAGFLKVENRERDAKLHLKIQNIPLGISGRFPIRVYDGDGWKEIDGIAVQEGRGSWEENLAKPADRVILKVMLPSGYYLEGRSRSALDENLRGKSEPTVEESVAREANPVSETNVTREANPVSETSVAREANPVSETSVTRGANSVRETSAPREVEPAGGQGEDPKDVRPVNEESAVREASPVKEQGMVKVISPMRGTGSVKAPDEEREVNLVKQQNKRETILIKEELPSHMPKEQINVAQNIPQYSLKEDKWEQILDTYENIHPYGDERTYVKLEPKDFVILQSKYQHLVNNSFLLHGFYNYRYVILGKEQDYYLGVPGVFYEREKMVALMFGFEAFECPGGNVRAGEFGYYLRKVEL